jgi:hypothetical protein
MKHRAVRSPIVAGLALLAALTGCSRGGSASTARQSAAATSCSLSEADARELVDHAVVTSRLPAIPGMPTPVERCLYEHGDQRVQLTVFRGDDMSRQLGILVAKATLEPRISPVAYCGGGRGSTRASFSCIFAHDSKTYVLALDVPNRDANDQLRDKVRSVAESLVKRAPPKNA